MTYLSDPETDGVLQIDSLKRFSTNMAYVFTGAGSGLNVLLITAFTKTYAAMAVKLNDRENHRTETEYKDALILKNFAFGALNNYFLLFYIAFFKWKKLFGADNACNSPDGSYDCMYELQFQMVIIFTAKMVFGQVMEIGMPFVKKTLKARSEAKALMKDKNMRGSVSVVQAMKPWEEQAKMEVYEGTFDDYNEMALQFGFMTLFASSFPLSAFLSWLNNLTEIRGDAMTLCGAMQRPIFRRVEDIGAWYYVLNLVGAASVITNSLILGFTSSATEDLLKADSGGTTFDRFSNGYIWGFVIMVEHLIFLSKMILAAVIPDEPDYINDQKEEAEYFIKVNMKSQSAIDEENQKAKARASKATARRSTKTKPKVIDE
jgi:hypothetical protein